MSPTEHNQTWGGVIVCRSVLRVALFCRGPFPRPGRSTNWLHEDLSSGDTAGRHAYDLMVLQAKIGDLTLGMDFLLGALNMSGRLSAEK